MNKFSEKMTENSSDSGSKKADTADDEPVRGRGRGRGLARGRGRGAATVRGRGHGCGVGRGRGRGAGTGRDRGRGRGRGAGNHQGAAAMFAVLSTYDDPDDDGPAGLPQFLEDENNKSGPQFPEDCNPGSELDFFQLCFDDRVVEKIVDYTNAYARAHIHERPTYANKEGQWTPTTCDEIRRLMAFLIYQGFARMPSLKSYWKSTSLFAGNYARRMIPSRTCFDALMCFLKIVDHTTENPGDRLRKIRYLYDHMRERCRKLYKPGQFIAVDEGMIKSKGRSHFIQYLPNKPVKWGFKQFALCDSETSVVVDFEVYTGGENNPGGLAHDAVVRLANGMENSNRILFTDNFYTSTKLANSLREKNIFFVSTMRTNRKEFPAVMQ